jgi:amino acid adenylation domain-containing protein
MSYTEADSRMDGVAIIGMAGKFPGAPDLTAFWENIRNGRDTITRFSRAELEARDAAAREFGPDYVPAHGVLEGAEMFDAGFFAISPRDADFMDPQHRMFLETCWSAVEDAGYDPLKFPGQIGLFGGCSLNTYLLNNLSASREFIEEITGNYQVGEFQATLGNDKDFLCTRVAYKMNLRGPCVTVQAACATSLVAVCQAAQSLLTYQCDMALAGGVSITFPQHRGYIYQEGSMGSRDGRCRPFDADATGTVFGHGAGIVVLKRLEDAIADGDRIDAVIRGFAVSNDGSAKVSYMAPGVDGQRMAISSAQAMAGISADAVTYVEAHGTATPLGDPVEVAALTEAFRATTQRNQFCALGSTKANIGHLDAAAGVSGLIKTVLAMRHATIPPLANFEKPNPHIDFAATPFYVNRESKPWTAEGPRIAGVSAFGVGGVNAHIVLEEGPRDTSKTSARHARLLCMSARSEEALDATFKNLGSHLGQHSDLNLADVAFTLQVGRHGFDHRAFVVCSDTRDASTKLTGDNRRISRAASLLAHPNPAFLFTGQGSQFPGMGKTLYQTEAVYRRRVDECSELLRPILNLDLRTMLFPAGGATETNADALNETQFAQPALFVTELAIASLWREWGIEAKAMAGHSLGEYVAAVMSGVMTWEDGLRLVALRGRLMQLMKRGAMLSVRLPETVLSPMLDKDLSIAAINSPSLCVVSGTFAAIEQLEKKLEAQSTPCKRLRTSHAFHSEMMEPMLEDFRAEVGRIALHQPTIPFVSGVSGTWITAAQAIDPDYWTTHCRKPVRFADAIALLLDQPEAVLLEVGPGQTLVTLATQQRGTRNIPVVASLPERSHDELTSGSMQEALGQLWIAGLEPDWNAFWKEEKRQRVPLPTYPFERKRHWIEPPAARVQTDVVLPVVIATQAVPSPVERELQMSPTSTPVSLERKVRLQPIVASMLEELSGIHVGPELLEASFLDLGFDSLFLTQVTQAIQRRFKVKVTFRQIVEQHSSVAALSAHLDSLLPADAFPAETVAPALDAASVAARPQAAALSASGSGTQLEELIKAQMTAMSQMFEQQLAALRGAGPTSSPVAQTLAQASPAASIPPASPTQAPAEGEAKAYGPFKPIQAGTKDGIAEEQHKHIQRLIELYTRKTPGSKNYTQEHRAHLADPRAVSGFRSLWKEMVYPLVTNRSKGSRIWDLDGNEYIDIVNGFGAIMFGHSPEFVNEAVREQIDLGVEIGPQSSTAGEVAAMICELTGMERAAFCNTGSEAVMAALRVARTVTARDKIVYFTGDYHGTFDEVLMRATAHGAMPIAPGITHASAEGVAILEYGSQAALNYIREHGEEIAAVLVEPVQSRHPEVQPREFLKELRQITEQTGSALIFDEVVTGFRVALGGAQEYYGIRADLATYGKVIGGGYPIGVVAGKAMYLDALDGGTWQYGDDSAPEVGMTFFAGTFVRHPLAMAAAKSVLHYLKDAGPQLQQDLARKVAKAAGEAESVFRKAGLDVGVHPCGAWFTFSMPSDARFGSLFYYHVRARGVHIQEGYPCFFTTAHSDEDFARVVTAFRESLEEMRKDGMLPTAGFVSAAPVALPVEVEAELHPDARHDVPAAVPLTESQREILLAAGRGDDVNCAFNESLTFYMKGSATGEEIRTALLTAINRHDALRSTVDPLEECLRIATEFAGSIPIVDLVALPEPERSSLLEKRAAEEARTPFDLSKGPLLRGTIFQLAEDQWALLINAHHIVMDGWSSNQLLEDMAKIFNAARSRTNPALPPLMPFSSYALREQEEVASGAYEENAKYWVKLFAGRAPVLDLPTDRPRPAVKTYSGSTFQASLGADLTSELKKLSARAGCTLYVTLLSGFQLLMHRLTRQSEVVVGISVAGQAQFGDASLVGHCVHFLPMLSELQKNTSASDYLAATRSSLLDTYDHQEFTYGTLLRKLTIQRDPSRLPLIEVQFNLEKLGSNAKFDGLETKMQSNPKRYVNTDLFLNAVEDQNDILLNCDFNTDLIDESTLRRWMASYSTMLRDMTQDATKPVERLEVLEAGERNLVLYEWNGTDVDFGTFEATHRAIERQAAQSPHRTALVCQGVEWSYQKLNEYSNRMARYLRRNGIGEGSLVGVCLQRSHEMVGAVLGVLKSGAAYLPLDPTHPSTRLQTVLSDSQAAMLLTQEDVAAQLRTSARVVCLDTEQKLWARESAADLDVQVTPQSLAYVIYTSGSTGKPKGVAIEHFALANLLRSMEREPGMNSNDTLVSVTTLSFDIAALELFLPLMVGARLVMATTDEVHDGFRLLRLLTDAQATVLQATPVGWRILLEAGWKGAPRLKVLCGGEAFPADLADSLLVYGEEVWNVYGPTETTIWSSATKLKRSSGPVRIGPPIANTQFYILDDLMQPVPIGVTGELYIGGHGLARGYWRNPELTAEKFVVNPFASGRIYRTGDLARSLPGGHVEVLGRTDFQVKIRGFRIELSEIEATLNSHPAVRDAVAAAIADDHGDKRLAVWVDSTMSPAPADLESQLYTLLSQKLPSYMQPSAITVLPALPRTANGKIDRKALPAPHFASRAQARIFTPAETPQQKKLAQIWAEVLKLDRVSITDSIFELGADSLLIFRLSARAVREGLPVQPAQIFQHRTIANLSRALGESDLLELAQVAPGPAIPAVSRERFRRPKA